MLLLLTLLLSVTQAHKLSPKYAQAQKGSWEGDKIAPSCSGRILLTGLYVWSA